MTPKVALVFCVHHKPWLIMSTLMTVAAQGHDDLDLHFLYQVGDGKCADRDSYAEYHHLAADLGANQQLSPWDERVRSVTQVGGRRFEKSLENDGALDSGAWYKFIRSGDWEPYDYVLFLGEGSLLARPDALSSMLAFAQANDVHCVAGGHEKRRMPKSLFMSHNADRPQPNRMDAFHDRMMREVFEIFSRDAAFRDLVATRWLSEFKVETQDHLPDIWGRSAFARRLRDAANRRENGQPQPLRDRARQSFYALDRGLSGLAITLGRERVLQPRPTDRIYVDRVLKNVEAVEMPVVLGRSRFHREPGPEWFGAATNHLMSRRFLQCFRRKLDAHNIWDAVDLPFAGTSLELVWGFLPPWLGFDKWFTDAIHRVRKHFVTYRREDDPEGMASYINRYYRGILQVVPDGDFLRITKTRRAGFHERLTAEYFA